MSQHSDYEILASVEDGSRRPDFDVQRYRFPWRQRLLHLVRMNRSQRSRLRLVQGTMTRPQPAKGDRSVVEYRIEREHDLVAVRTVFTDGDENIRVVARVYF